MDRTDDRTPFDWEQRFRTDDTPWEREALHPAFKAWQATGAFARGERGLVPGCGRCPEVLALAARGVSVTGADLAATALAWQAEQAQAAGLDVTLLEGDVLAWTPQQSLDFVYEQTFLCAIHPSLRTDYEAALLRWLKPGGRLHALFMQKDESGGPPYGCSLDAMRVLFDNHRWIWPEPESIQPWPHPRLNGKPELGAVLIRR